MTTITYAQLKLLVENNLVIKPEKLTLDEFYQWTLLTGNYNFFQLLPYLQSGGCIYRISTMLEGEYIKLASFPYMPECLHFTKYKNGISIGIFIIHSERPLALVRGGCQAILPRFNSR